MENDKSREVRLGLVMYGGVSLAIYINGVSSEFYRAVRGNSIYKFIKALTDSEIIVDIISGTSAGGINGIFLSYALTNNLAFSSTSELWRKLGDIGELLRDPKTEPEFCESLLDSENFYQNRLAEAFKNMTKLTYDDSDDDPSEIKELDLFITGTDLDGNIYTTFDDGGHPIDVKDHRAVFLLKHRKDRKEPFNPKKNYANEDVAYEALAKLARITSCFPAAFAPVHVKNQKDESVDSFLQTWGKLDKESYFLDGGVLDNKPFTYTIKEIFYRSADCDVERLLYYVEPDPERFQRTSPVKPTFFHSTVEGGHGIKSYESIADDLRLIAEHNTRVELFRRLSKDLRNKIPRSPKPLGVVPPKTMPEPLRTLYLNSRFASISERAVHGVLRVEGKDQYLTGKNRREASNLIKAFDEWKGDGLDTLQKFDVYFRLRRLFHVTYRIKEALYDFVTIEWQKDFADMTITVSKKGRMALIIGDSEHKIDLSKANHLQGLKEAINKLNINVKAIIIKLDQGFRLRLRGPDYCKLQDADDTNDSSIYLQYCPLSEELINLWKSVNCQIKFLEIIRFWMEYVIDSVPIVWEDLPAETVWEDINWALEKLLDISSESGLIPPSYHSHKPPHERLDQEDLSKGYQALKKRAEDIKKDFEADPQKQRVVNTKFSGLLGETDKYENAFFDYYTAQEIQEIKAEYDEFLNLDANLFPLEFISDLHEKDIIKTVRISPLDAQKGFSNRPIEEKVAGDALAHFGGFFKKSWRSNDILWGRLDTLCQLVECLITPERLERILWNDCHRNKIRNRFFPRENMLKPEIDLNSIFPHCGQKSLDNINSWLKGLFDNNEQIRKAALVETESIVDLLIEIAQLEVLYQEVPIVISDSIDQQASWNQYRVHPKNRKNLSSKKIEKAIADFDSRNPSDDPSLDLELCIALAGWTGEDELKIKQYLPKSKRWNENKEKWLSTPQGGSQTYEELLIKQAIGRSKMSYDLENGVFRPGNGIIDPLVSTVASEQYAKMGLSQFHEDTPINLSPSKTKMGLFFRNNYWVGSEQVFKHIPGLVLLEIMTAAMLVLRNCILGSFPESTRKRVTSYSLYKFGVKYPLNAVHELIKMWRQEPISIIIFQTIVTTASALALLISITWWDTILVDTSSGNPLPRLKWDILLFFLPLILLALQMIYGARINKWVNKLGWLTLFIFIAVLAMTLILYFLHLINTLVTIILLGICIMVLFISWLWSLRHT